MDTKDFPPPHEHAEPDTHHAIGVVSDLMQEAGPGTHFVTAFVRGTDANGLVANTYFQVFGEGPDALWYGDEEDTVAVAQVVALAFILGAGSIVLGTLSPTDEMSARGWVIQDSALTPLPAAVLEQRAHEMGLYPVPEFVTYRDAFPLLAVSEARQAAAQAPSGTDSPASPDSHGTE
ncbi:hypothetical protein [Streptomyces sp. NPDC005784]|uniref:hypothetical protein n=1 Tax=Streptomyces sp. NPDC005784 TaxID=3364731 RepID=UPI0036A82EA1